MKISYDKEIDAKYISLKEGAVSKTHPMHEWLMVDMDENGVVLGIEILDASKNLVSVNTDNNDFVQIIEMTQFENIDPEQPNEIVNMFAQKSVQLERGALV